MTSQRLGWQTCDQPSSAGPSGFHQCHWTRQISENRTSIYSSVTWQYIVWVCSAPKWTHRPSSLRSTWLPVSQRVVFKTALMVWKCVRDVAPAYLSDICVPTAISGRQTLRSAATGTLLVPHARTAMDNEFSQLTDLPHGTVCHQHYGHRTCRTAPSSGHWKRTCSRPPGVDSSAGYKYPDLLTYLLPEQKFKMFYRTIGYKNCTSQNNCKFKLKSLFFFVFYLYVIMLLWVFIFSLLAYLFGAWMTCIVYFLHCI